MKLRTWLAVIGCVLAVFFGRAGPAGAHIGHDKPRLELGKKPATPREGPRGRAELAGGPVLRLARASDGSFVAGFEVRNVGDGPLNVLRVAVLSEADGGAPPPAGLGIQTLPRATTLIAPGESRLYNVVWRPDQTRASQALAHVVIESDSAAPGASEFDAPIVAGVVADRRPGPVRFALSAAVLAPLLLVVLALATRRRPQGSARTLRFFASAVALISALLAAVPVATFVRGLGKGDGNDGLQHVERFVLSGAFEYFLGVDGLSAALLPIPAFVLLVCLLASSDQALSRYAGVAGALTSATVLVLVSQNLGLVAVGVVACALCASMLVVERGPAGRLGRGSVACLVSGVAASAAFAWLAHHLARVPEPHARLLDGRVADVAYALPEAVRALAHSHEPATLFGLPLDRALVVLAVVSAAALSGVVPFYASPRARVEADAARVALAQAATSMAGLYVLLRFGVLLTPDAARWAAPIVAVLGVATILASVMRSVSADDVRQMALALPLGATGAAWVAASSLTPQGLQAAIGLGISRALAGTLLVLCVGFVVARTGETSLSSASGVGRSAPRLGLALALALLGSSALPVGSGFWAALLGVIGAGGRSPAQGVVLALGLLAVCAAHARLWRLVAGLPSPSWVSNARLEPHGGTVPDLRPGAERISALVLSAMLVVLSFAPRAWIGVTNHVILDALPELDPPGPTQVAGQGHRRQDGTET